MKKLLAILLAVVFAISLVSCSGGALGVGGGNKHAIVGTWKLVDEETQTEYGLGIQFTSDGKLSYGLTLDDLTTLTGDEDVDKALSYLMSIDYKIVSETEMEITVSAMFGLASETTTVNYSLNGDTLVFDGAVYTRVK